MVRAAASCTSKPSPGSRRVQLSRCSRGPRREARRTALLMPGRGGGAELPLMTCLWVRALMTGASCITDMQCHSVTELVFRLVHLTLASWHKGAVGNLLCRVQCLDGMGHA